MASREARALGCAVLLHSFLIAATTLVRVAPCVRRPATKNPPHARVELHLVETFHAPSAVARPVSHEPRAAAPHAARLRTKSTVRTPGMGAAARARASGDRSDAPDLALAPPADGERSEEESWSEPSTLEPRLELSWSERIELGSAPAPAPTAPPARRKVTGEDAAEAIAAGIRAHDSQLGLGNPEHTRVAHAVQLAGRATGLPNRTRWRVQVEVARDGALLGVTLVSASAGSEQVWSQFLADVAADLAASPIPLGPDAKIAGAKLVVDALLIHAFPSGTDERVVVGECPKLAVVGGEAQPHFQNIGGTAYGLPANGLCALQTVEPASSKTIQVRTQLATVLPRMAPPPLDALGPNEPAVRRLPSVQELIVTVLQRLLEP